jgi:hypothetical protein
MYFKFLILLHRFFLIPFYLNNYITFDILKLSNRAETITQTGGS